MPTFSNSPIKLNILCSCSTKGGTIFKQRGLSCEKMELQKQNLTRELQTRSELKYLKTLRTDSIFISTALVETHIMKKANQ